MRIISSLFGRGKKPGAVVSPQPIESENKMSKFTRILGAIGKGALQVAGIASGIGPLVGGTIQSFGVNGGAAIGARIGSIAGGVIQFREPVEALLHGPLIADAKGLRGTEAMQDVLQSFESFVGPTNAVLKNIGMELRPDMAEAKAISERALANLKKAEEIAADAEVIAADAKAFWASLKPIPLDTPPAPGAN